MEKRTSFPGTFYVVATPIGNLEDITFRSIRILKEVDFIAAEDTRHTIKLLSHYDIRKPLISCHEHNEQNRIIDFTDKLKNGYNIALVTDAGTPCISDPGYRIVNALALDHKLNVIPLPGPCAAIAGLSVSALPSDSFLFSGFPPRKKSVRRKHLENLKNEPSTLIFYESPKRILSFIEEVIKILGDRPAMLAREMTKVHEEYIRGSLSDILATLQAKIAVKGECVLFVSRIETSSPEISQEKLDQEIVIALNKGEMHTTSLAKELSLKFSISKKQVYDRILFLKKQHSNSHGKVTNIS